MLYMILSKDTPNSLDKRTQARPAHLARLEVLKQQGRLILAGPLPNIDCETPGEQGFSGSLVVAEFDSLEDAKAWAKEDPYFDTGAYESVDVRPFKKVLP